MVSIPKGIWKPSLSGPNEFHLIWFDPGGHATGWTHFVVDCRAFSRPEHKLLPNIISWNCGEFTGPENSQLEMAEKAITSVHYAGTFRAARITIGTENFELTQTYGGKDLLSPVRINAALDYICYRQQIALIYQSRTMRTQTTKEKLHLYGFQGRFRKDEFAAMQHSIIALKRIKADSKAYPWKLSDGIVANAFYDCSCAKAHLLPIKARSRITHNLMHP